MRRPISVKIFSIALGLLVLMAIVTVLSARNLSKVNNEVLALSEYYIPLEQRLASVGSHVRDQIIHLERLLQLHRMKSLSPAIEQEKRLFDEKGGQADQEIDAAVRLVQEALSSTSIEVDLVKFAVLQKELPDILTAHQHLHETALMVLAEEQHGNPRSIHLVHEAIRNEKASVDKEIHDVTAELQTLTRESSRKAASQEQHASRLNWGITLVASILGLVFAAILTRNLVRPVRELLSGTKAIEQGNLNIHIRVNSADEIASLAESFNHMVVELRQKEVIKETFGKYVDPRIVKKLLEDQRFSQEGEKRFMTVFFSDLEGFTALSERLTPNGVVRLLNQYFTLMSEPIRQNNGIIDKYIGDALMAFWGPPFTDGTEHARLACWAALEQITRLEKFRQMLPDIMGLRKGLPTINIRMGLASGDVTVGNIGSEFSKGYTVIGDPANLASRLETVNKQYGTHILISEETWKIAKDSIEARELDSIRVAGKSEPVRVYELLGRKGQLDQAVCELRDRFEEGLALYRNHQWERAQTCFEACLKLNPEDPPAKLFVARLQHFREHPPEDDWDGVWSFKEK
ncbi:MAG TPA: adenylate/guanylate cyclase domain-containing protein [Nitrospiraceae bacterium]|nr:adenylate/guanylate cyclase domain-containing protein [Nitrospiraceae bacterium]